MQIIHILLSLVGLAIYMTPTVIAIVRHHKNAIGICLVNFFFGWTILGWFIALIWSILYGQDLRQERTALNHPEIRPPDPNLSV